MIGLRLSQSWLACSRCQSLVEFSAPNTVLANEKSAVGLLGNVYLTNKRRHMGRNSLSSPQDSRGGSWWLEWSLFLASVSQPRRGVSSQAEDGSEER